MINKNEDMRNSTKEEIKDDMEKSCKIFGLALPALILLSSDSR